MAKVYSMGRIGDLDFAAEPSAGVASVGVGVAGWVLGRRWGLSPGRAAGLGLALIALHWVSEISHQLGHAAAARGTGYPMTGITLWGPFSKSGYPADEPELPAEIHMRRALGGGPVNIVIGLALAVLAGRLRPANGVPARLVRLVALENLLIFGFGAFVPLGFNDGSTLLHWWPKRGAAR
jgi:hypothetical protein